MTWSASAHVSVAVCPCDTVAQIIGRPSDESHEPVLLFPQTHETQLPALLHAVPLPQSLPQHADVDPLPFPQAMALGHPTFDPPHDEKPVAHVPPHTPPEQVGVMLTVEQTAPCGIDPAAEHPP